MPYYYLFLFFHEKRQENSKTLTLYSNSLWGGRYLVFTLFIEIEFSVISYFEVVHILRNALEIGGRSKYQKNSVTS